MNRKNILLLLLPIFASTITFGKHADSLKIVEHLTNITQTEAPRNHLNIETLDSVAAYIYNHFDQFADTTYYQEFGLGKESEKTYRNVIGVFGAENKETIVIGAHYDVCGNQQGADDNASGVVGLLELARLLDGEELRYRIEMVAYTLEEPPYFRSVAMGSYVHAESLIKNETNVYGMVCLEMIGYFDDAKGSQDYPIGMLSLIYGKKGDYITLVNKFNKGKFPRKFSKHFKKNRQVKTKKFTGPIKLAGIDFSDHLNYWHFGINAVMITDTAFYRNKNYHKKTDTMEKLDIQRMSKVIDTLYDTIVNL
jgi:Zn-dependent M28 family amino/carboxypeptidase